MIDVSLRRDAEAIVRAAIAAVRPDAAVRRALAGRHFSGRVYLAAVGKAGWQMAKTALDCLDRPPAGGIVVTKYGHLPYPLPGLDCREAGHPLPDQNSFAAAQAVLEMTRDLTPRDTVLFLLSGGGSSLFEYPALPAGELQDITRQLLAAGADIVEINTIRKRLSLVKGGRFAQWCAPAQVEAIVLSDILGDPLDMIASGPAAPDPSTSAQALAIAQRYGLRLSDRALACLNTETLKSLDNVHTQIIGSVRELARAAARECTARGYTPFLLTDHLDIEAREAGRFLADILLTHAGEGKLAFLAGGETVVHLKGRGLGGRNQELALAAAPKLAALPGAAVISVGSDGTDGPTDAAGGYADSGTMAALAAKGLDCQAMLDNNDSYHALQAVGGLVVTGPTGTNVNDISIGLLG